MVLVGTHEECVAELKHRVGHWGVGQFIFSTMMGGDETQIRRLKEEVLAHV